MFRIISALLLLSIALIITLLNEPAIADTENAESWAVVPLPSGGKSGSWALTRGTDIRCLGQASDGTLYCHATLSGTSYKMYKSKDGGTSWEETGNVTDNIVDISPAPGNPDIVYYATASEVYKSTDGAESFTPFQFRPGGAGTGSVTISAIDVVEMSGYFLVAAATKDDEIGQFGGVFLYNESDPDPLTGWIDTGIGPYDVYDIGFSPKMVAGRWHLVAIVNDETSTLVKTRIEDSGWGSLINDTPVITGTIGSASLAFPDNYGASQSDFTVFVGIDTGTDGGDVYVAYGGVVPAASSCAVFNINRSGMPAHVDVSSVAAAGDSRNAIIIAGAARNGFIYSSKDGGATWNRSTKPPTGTSVSSVLFAEDFATTGMIYAGTRGSGAGFAVSTNYGATWIERSLIDTGITGLVDLAVSPGYDLDGTIFLLAFDSSIGKHSLWRTVDGGSKWERIFSSSLPDVDSIDYIRLSPEYGANGKVVFVCGTSSGRPAVWQSSDGGSNFTQPRPTWDTDTGMSFSIMQCAVVDNNTLVIGTYNGLNGMVYISRNAGRSYSSGATIGTALTNSIAVSPDYSTDKSILVGDQSGTVFFSTDGGNSFSPVVYTSAVLTGSVSVAFDSQFRRNKNIYAAGETAGSGIFRFVIGHSTEWQKIDATLPTNARMGRIAISTGGTLYAVDATTGTGIERSLNPRVSGAVFETVTRNLESTSKLNGLSVVGNSVWTMDTANSRLMNLFDTLASPVELTSPEDQMAGAEVRNTVIDWEPSAGATLYEWQLDTDSGFTTIPSGFTDTTQSTSANLPELEPGTTYHWHVRAAGPILSPWSVSRSFTTKLAGNVDSPKLNSPEFGAKVPVKPVFQWEPVAGATGYELMIDVNPDFADPVVNKAAPEVLNSTAWQCNTGLHPDTVYYWKVRAVSARSVSDWSNTGVFTTDPATSLTQAAAAPSFNEMAVLNTIPVTATVTVTQTTSPAIMPATTQVIQMQQSAPEWLRPLIYVGGAFIVVMLIIIGLLVMVVLRKN